MRFVEVCFPQSSPVRSNLHFHNFVLWKAAFQEVDCVWNVMAHAQKPDLVFRRNGRVHLNRQGRQFSRLMAAEVRASAVVMLDTPCSEVVWRVLATHSIRQFPLQFPSRASPCAITFQLESNTVQSGTKQQELRREIQLQSSATECSNVVSSQTQSRRSPVS